MSTEKKTVETTFGSVSMSESDLEVINSERYVTVSREGRVVCAVGEVTACLAIVGLTCMTMCNSESLISTWFEPALAEHVGKPAVVFAIDGKVEFIAFGVTEEEWEYYGPNGTMMREVAGVKAESSPARILH